MNRVRSSFVVVVAVGLLVVVLRTSSYSPFSTTILNVAEPRTPAAIIPARCPPDGAGLGGDSAGPGVEFGGVPDGFRPQSVWRCQLDFSAARTSASGHSRYRVLVQSAPSTPALLQSLALPDRKIRADQRGGLHR